MDSSTTYSQNLVTNAPTEHLQFTYKLLSKDTKGLGPLDIDVEFSLRFNRFTDGATEDLVRRTWKERFEDNPQIFDGKKFRVHELKVPASLATDHACRPRFRLGLTSYREYLGTNMSDQAAELRRKGERKHGNPQAYLSDPLGVGALVLTADNKFVLLRRSNLCSEAQGLLDGPGGHAEPDMVPGLLKEPETEVSLKESIVAEIFDSILREIVDEVNIARSALSEARLLGVSYNHTTAQRCSLEFIVECRLTSDKILKNFKLGGHAESDESTDIVFIDEEAATASPLTSDSWHELAPACKAKLAIYKNLKEK